jgi:hypothetical protein
LSVAEGRPVKPEPLGGPHQGLILPHFDDHA